MPDSADPTPHRSRLRRGLARWADTEDQHDRDLRRAHADTGETTSIAEAPDRERVRLRGTIKTVTLRPRGGVPALEAELADGSGVILLVWLGRRRIAGVGPGRAMYVEGLIGTAAGHRVLFNPRYELIP